MVSAIYFFISIGTKGIIKFIPSKRFVDFYAGPAYLPQQMVPITAGWAVQKCTLGH